jgi:hypothetical protein
MARDSWVERLDDRVLTKKAKGRIFIVDTKGDKNAYQSSKMGQ